MKLAHSADRRGVTPIVGFVLLMGLVAVIVLGVFLVGTSLTGATQQTVEDRQASNSMSELASEIDRLITGDVDTGTFLIDGSDGSVTDVDPTAGRLQIAIEKNGMRTQVYDEPIGSIQYRSGGTKLAYQGGGIWRSGEGSPVLVEPPRFDYRSSPSPTLTLPVISVQGDASASGEFDGSLSVANRSDVFPAMGFENPLRADRVIIDVQSEYCSAWGSYVDGQTDGSVVEGCSETINTSTDELRVELPVANDSVTIGTPSVNTTPTISTPSVEEGDGTVESSTTVDEPTVDSPGDGPDETDPTVEPIVDPGDPTESEGSDVYGLYVENGLELNSLGGQVQGSLGAGGIVQDSSASLAINGSMDEGISSTRDPHGDEIQQILDDAEEEQYVENFCGGPYQSCTISGSRAMIVEESEFNGGGGQVTFDVSEGNVTLLVEGDLETEPYTQWEITGHESGHSVNVYTTGDLELGSGHYATEETDLTGFQPVNKWEEVSSNEYHPEALTFYASEDAEVSTSNSVAIEGSISAPGAGTGSSLDLRMVGAIYLGSWDVNDASLNLYPASGSYGRPDDDDSESSGTVEVAVTDAKTTTPVPATVGVYDGDELVESGATDDSGAIEFEVDPGSYRIVANASGYLATNTSGAPVVAGGTTEVELPLAAEPSAPTSGTISGNVSNVSTGDPVTDVIVEATYASNDTVAATAVTNVSGEFSMELPDGAYGLTAHTGDDYNDGSVAGVDVVASADTDVAFELAPDSTSPTVGILSVTVENGTNGAAVAGAAVQIETSDGAAIDTSSTSSSGTVSVDDLDASSDYVVTVSHPEYESNTAFEVPINATGTTGVTVPLRPEGYSSTGTPSGGTDSSALYYLHVSETEIVVEA